jgi:subtilisin-like proprotein convertase family protein
LGTEPFSFQWYFNDSPISGGASNVFTIPHTSFSDAGNYHVVVTNRAGAATSAVVRLVFVLPSVALANATPIQINSNNVTPYPSEIVVQGVTGNVLKVRVTLCGLTDDSPVDLSVFLQGPRGENVLLMSDSGEDSGAYNLTITFDDEAWAMLQDDIYSGTYSPRDPLSVFNGLDPNGTWRLFVDNASWLQAEIACGWQLTLLVADPAANSRPSINSIVCAGDHVSLQWDGVPGRRLQRSSSLTNPDWTDVPDSEGQSAIQLPLGGGNQFFRLTGP